ncbi:ATP phosphoribosyltransferase regulatory subunit [Alkalibacter rhizosphaerae]|uniref:ATP phosphoribosyltransferase regulatory subunit n=1 Tax=Alkalibacter rhizosphaerae TaxID=2815577 RepID=A0A974XFE2_9FIRM|nr:ATP phosphoribosyltransferase regulatory subunit [Alkalibacter rhizosphaerae]QSX07610.1 ATP phosphoribosyltransferase regulatory subunit [Alkalibacter rhizosphaerae]
MINYYIDGVNDLHFQELLGYERINDAIEGVMRRYGYKPILTPNFEYYDMYSMDTSLSRDKMFKLIDKTGKVMVLRPDATIPICRMAANTFKDPKEVLKFSYITTIFREDNSKTNYRKDFIQGGVEYFGNEGADCDGEVIAVAVSMLQDLGLKNIHIDVGQVAFLDGLLSGLDLAPADSLRINELIENKNLGDLKVCLSNLNIEAPVYDVLMKVPMLFGAYDDVLPKARALCINPAMEKAIKNLEEVYRILKAYEMESYLYLDFGFTNQLNYYSGLIFKGYAQDWGDSLLSGGRYDHLSSTFGVDRPACGFGINISLLTEVLGGEESHMDYFDALIRTVPSQMSTAIATASLLRQLGRSVNLLVMDHAYDPETYRRILQITEDGLYMEEGAGLVPITTETLLEQWKGESLR